MRMAIDFRLCREKSSTSSNPIPLAWAALHASVIAVWRKLCGRTFNPTRSPSPRTTLYRPTVLSLPFLLARSKFVNRGPGSWPLTSSHAWRVVADRGPARGQQRPLETPLAERSSGCADQALGLMEPIRRIILRV